VDLPRSHCQCDGHGRQVPACQLQVILRSPPQATKAPSRGLFSVRPAWAHSWRCKSSRELVTVSEVKRNCTRVTECGKEARSVNREPMNKNQIEGDAEQGERAENREAFVTKAQVA
jgi:hypothetical protein